MNAPPAVTRTRRTLRAAATVAAMGFVVWFYHWTVRTSGGFGAPGEEDYYNFLIRGWRAGHLYMSKEPRPEMIALADPYDPAQNSAVRLGDASYFKGHYYLYFGAGPAAIFMLPYDIITGREIGTTTTIYVFCVTGYLALCGGWLAVRGRYFPASADWVGPAGVLLLGLGTHVLALERRALVWELPIAMGFAFSALALVAVYWALHGRRPVLAMGLAGLSLGLAVTARPTCLLGAVMLVSPLWQLRRASGVGVATWVRGAVAAASGLGLCVLAALAHNFARFGRPLEFGQNYQLSGVYESKMQHFRLSYLLHNLYVYGFHPAHWTAKFPFVAASAVRGGPAGYLGDWNEAIAGLGVTFPFVWLALLLPLAWWNRGAEERRRMRALMFAMALYCFALSAVILGYFVATPRYLADFAPTLMLIAAYGWLGLERWAQQRSWTQFVMPMTAAFCVATAVAGVLVSFDYHDRLLQRLNPPVWSQLVQWFKW